MSDAYAKVSFYHQETGFFDGTHFMASDRRIVALNVPQDHKSIDGHHDHLSKKVDIATGLVVDYMPPQPSESHEWNAAIKRWELCAAAKAKELERRSATARIETLDRESIGLLRQMALGSDRGYARLAAIEQEVEGLEAKL